MIIDLCVQFVLVGLAIALVVGLINAYNISNLGNDTLKKENEQTLRELQRHADEALADAKKKLWLARVSLYQTQDKLAGDKLSGEIDTSIK